MDLSVSGVWDSSTVLKPNVFATGNLNEISGNSIVKVKLVVTDNTKISSEDSVYFEKIPAGATPDVGDENLWIITGPNPFRYGTETSGRVNSQVMIEYNLPMSGEADIAIYDVSGGLAILWEDGGLQHGEGRHTFFWDGRRTDGRALANGVYFVVLSFVSAHGEEYKSFWKMAVLRQGK